MEYKKHNPLAPFAKGEYLEIKDPGKFPLRKGG